MIYRLANYPLTCCQQRCNIVFTLTERIKETSKRKVGLITSNGIFPIFSCRELLSSNDIFFSLLRLKPSWRFQNYHSLLYDWTLYLASHLDNRLCDCSKVFVSIFFDFLPRPCFTETKHTFFLFKSRKHCQIRKHRCNNDETGVSIKTIWKVHNQKRSATLPKFDYFLGQN